MQIINDIQNYLDFLQTEHHLQITLHPSGQEMLIRESCLMEYNFHSCTYCLYMKSQEGVMHRCIQKQQRIREKLSKVRVFSGLCHAGVWERVYGLYRGEDVIGFLSVGGYQGENAAARARIFHLEERFGISSTETLEVYQSLQAPPPKEEQLDALLFPLCHMIEYGNLLLPRKEGKGGGLYLEVLTYIHHHFSEPLSLANIAAHFHVSPSTLSHTFKKNNGRGLREYLCQCRIAYAKGLLTMTNKTVTDIAMLSGFSDSAYFCHCFQRQVGATPTDYRKSTAAALRETEEGGPLHEKNKINPS